MREKMQDIVRINAARRKKEKKQKRPNVNIRGWHYIRPAIIERDNYACRICGDDDQLHVHHIDYSRQNNDDSNLVTLCKDCHMAIHYENYRPYEHDDYPPPWGVL